jgi:histone deacetylase 1/2
VFLPSCSVTEQLTVNKYYAPDYELDVRPSNMDNANSREYLEKIRVQVIENLKRTAFAPSMQMQDVPRDSLAVNDDDEAAMDDLDDDENPDRRRTQRRFDKYIEKDGELSDSEDEEMNEANGVRKQPGTRKRRNRMDFRHLTDFNDSGVDSNIATPLAGSSLPDNDVDEDMNLDDAGPAEADEAQTPSPGGVTNPSAAVSGEQSPQAAADTEDVQMEDADAQPAVATNAANQHSDVRQEVTPPDSPPAPPQADAPPPSEAEAGPSNAEPVVKDEMAAENAPVSAQDNGLGEGEEKNAEGELATEQATG